MATPPFRAIPIENGYFSRPWVAWFSSIPMSGGGSSDASSVSYVPSSGQGATNVQDAIDQLNEQKQPSNSRLTALAGSPLGTGYLKWTGAGFTTEMMPGGFVPYVGADKDVDLNGHNITGNSDATLSTPGDDTAAPSQKAVKTYVPNAPLVGLSVGVGTVTSASTIVQAMGYLEHRVALDDAKVSFPEAPDDGQQYARKNEAWEVVTSSSGGLVTVSASAPITGDGTSGNPLAIAAATDAVNGYLSSADHTAFAAKVSFPGFGTTNTTAAYGDHTHTGFASSSLTSAHILVGSAGGVATDVAMSGDATMANTGAITISADAVTLAKMANLAANSIMGNNTASAINPIAMTVAQTKTLLNYTASDVGALASGGTAADSNKLGGALPAAYALIGQTFYFGTTQVAINRASSTLAVTGVTFSDALIDNQASDGGHVASVVLNNQGATEGSGTAIYMGYNPAGSVGIYGARILQIGYPSGIRSSDLYMQVHKPSPGDNADTSWWTGLKINRTTGLAETPQGLQSGADIILDNASNISAIAKRSGTELGRLYWSTNGHIILGAVSGSIYLRPNGYATATAQLVYSTAGVLTVPTINVGGVQISNATDCIRTTGSTSGAWAKDFSFSDTSKAILGGFGGYGSASGGKPTLSYLWVGPSYSDTTWSTRFYPSGVVRMYSLTASRAVFTDASKNLVSVATTGTGSVVLSADPTFTGTLTCSDIELNGLISTDPSAGVITLGGGSAKTVVLCGSNGYLGAFGSSGSVKQTITGSRGGNAALASLLTALANHGIITNSTTA